MTKYFLAEDGITLEGTKENLTRYLREIGEYDAVYYCDETDSFLEIQKIPVDQFREIYIQKLNEILGELSKVPLEDFCQVAIGCVDYAFNEKISTLPKDKKKAKYLHLREMYDDFNSFCDRMGERVVKK